MAIGAPTTWRIRVSGVNTNGGGYDSTIAGAGTDYTDQDAAQLSLTDLATSGAGSTTLTSATGGFTAAMVGNCVRISSGTNFQTGYYFVTAHTDTNTVTLDRTPTSGGAGSAGVGSLGGAFATFEPLMTAGSGGLSTPSITTPLAAGHTIYVRGAGSDDPGADDYDYKGSAAAYQGYYTVPNGSTANGRIAVIGYNGRPQIRHSGILFLNAQYWHLENLKFVKHDAGTGWPAYGIFDSNTSTNTYHNTARNCICDLNSIDATGLVVENAWDVEVRNTGGGAAGTNVGIALSRYGGAAIGCYIDGVRGDGIRETDTAGSMSSVISCIVRNVGRDGIRASGSSYGMVIQSCTINNCGSDGIEVTHATAIANVAICNCILSNNAGYGLNVSVGSTALNDRVARSRICHNTYYGNTSGTRNNLSAGPNDDILDPGYTDAANENFTVGANMKATGFPGAFRGSATTGYLDRGAVQRQEPAGGGGPGPRVHQVGASVIPVY